jgi:hypothetical protein
MEQTFNAEQIIVGFHPDGYRIAKNASSMNLYTKWEIFPGNKWHNPESICFDSLPQEGWFAKDRFDWDKPNNIEVYA